MTWLLWAALAVGLVAFWLWFTTGSIANDIPNPAFFARALRLLLSRGVHKGSVHASMLLCPRGDKRRGLVFTKYVHRERGAGFTTAIRSDGWMAPYYAELRAELDRRGIRYTTRRVRRAQSTLEFDFGQDFGGAYMLARLLYEDHVGLRLHDDCVLYLRTVAMVNAPELTGVDAPNDNWF